METLTRIPCLVSSANKYIYILFNTRFRRRYLLYNNKWVDILYEEDSDVGAVAATTGRCVVQRRTIIFSFLPPLSARDLQSCLRYNSLQQH